jgi:hypothetical protein
VPPVGIRGVQPRGEPRFRQVQRQLSTRERQEWAHEVIVSRCNSRQSCRPGPSEGAHQNRLDLIIRMVRRVDDPGTKPDAERLQPGVAFGSGSGLSDRGAEVEAAHMKRQRIGAGEGFYLLGDPSAIRMDPVIHMGDNQVLPVQVAGLEQQVKKGYRIGAAGNRNQGRPDRKVESSEMAPERVDHGHGED